MSCPHTHQQNGVAEQKHRHIVKTGLTLLAQSSISVRFWDKAFLTATYLINHLPSRVIENTTPLFGLLGTTPDYSVLKVFGCSCWPNLRPYNTRKLAFRSQQCVLLGYSSLHKGYKYLHRSTGRVYISRGVVFDESIFHFANSSSFDSSCSASSPLNTILPTLLPPLNTSCVHELVIEKDHYVNCNPSHFASNDLDQVSSSSGNSPTSSESVLEGGKP